ncbi:hypothetical protein D9X30_3642 [Cupriavidus sp. U2]|uniref:Fic/DOC family protein n=1 Tax=Cupriavidus sp. U2 TaxID=2920269 RepID=UPI00129E41E3|nr:Fic family protein [Cupriavidus sp. U2]KAI3591435.1 hypothetical protein D9X30_3642 [Cupriavidus sp. U2]
MFDPFGDFDTAGYLRNFEKLKDLEEVKIQEHAFFEANLEDALAYLNAVPGPLDYENFLEVHSILFRDFYPWAGQDRRMLDTGRLVGKGEVQFEASERCRQAVEWGLRMGNDPSAMRRKPGVVMGAFAWGHPFLDGNGRAMLLVHTVLSARAGFCIDWPRTRKNDYLRALTAELQTPDKGILDRYLAPLVRPLTAAEDWIGQLLALPGLDGSSQKDDNIAYRDNDAAALARYRDVRRTREQSLGPDT